MATVQSYPVRPFTEQQKFFVYDPASQTSSLVTGADIKQSIQAGESAVVATSTFKALKTESYAIGTIIQTSGGNAIGDTSNGLYVIQPPGSGGTPIFNGNEAVELPVVNFVVSDVSGAAVTNANGTRTIEALADDVDLKIFRATNAADVAALPAVPGYQVSVSGSAAGTFEFSGTNFASAVGADAAQFTYIAPTEDPTGASGAWIRQPEIYRNSATSSTKTTTQGAIDELYINAQWLGTPVGGYLYLQTDMEGVEEPPTDSNLFRYAKLTAGLTGLEDYNEGILSGESVAGGAPDIIATASISQGVLSGLTVSLLNTERRFIRPGSSGMIQSDEFRSHTHVQSWVSFKDQTSSGPESERGVVSTTTNTQASGGDETRPKNIGVTAYMRIS